MEALLVIDVQNDFLKGGSLAVPNGNEIIPKVNELINQFELVYASQDWHPKQHISFASEHAGKNPFDVIELEGKPQTLWPDHCVQGTVGAEFHKDILTDRFEAIIRKGTNPMIDSYSAFYDNHKLKSTGLSGLLKEKGITTLHICGLALDFCVFYSLKDALDEGFKVVLHEEATRGIGPSAIDLYTDFEPHNNFAKL